MGHTGYTDLVQLHWTPLSLFSSILNVYSKFLSTMGASRVLFLESSLIVVLIMGVYAIGTVHVQQWSRVTRKYLIFLRFQSTSLYKTFWSISSNALFHAELAMPSISVSNYPVFETMACLPRSMASSLLDLPRSCHDLVMILARIPWPCRIVQRLTMILARMPRLTMFLTRVACIMICYDLDRGTMVNHNLARLTIIMASNP